MITNPDFSESAAQPTKTHEANTKRTKAACSLTSHLPNEVQSMRNLKGQVCHVPGQAYFITSNPKVEIAGKDLDGGLCIFF